MYSKSDLLEELDAIYRLGRRELAQVRNYYDNIIDTFPDCTERDRYNALLYQPKNNNPLDDPNVRQSIAEDTAKDAAPFIRNSLSKLHTTWYEPASEIIRKTGFRNFLLRFEEGETKKTFLQEVLLKEIPNDFEVLGDTLYKRECQLAALREIIEDYESTSQEAITKNNDTKIPDDNEIIAYFSFTNNYAICVNNRIIHTFQVGNSVADDFKHAFEKSGVPIQCKSKNSTLKSTISNLNIPSELRKLFVRQNNNKLMVNTTIIKADLIRSFVPESRIEIIKKELLKVKSGKE